MNKKTSVIDRRIFLKSSGLALVAGALLPNVFVRMAEAATTGGRKTLVTIFQRGAVDGLNVVIPYGEASYYSMRRNIAIARPGKGVGAALDLDGFFGLHPAMQPLLPHFKNHSLAFVHASGSPDTTRSHFDAQDFMEAGTPGVKSTADGFLARALAQKPPGKASPMRAVSLTSSLPRILAGSAGAIAMTDVSRFGVHGGGSATGAAETFESMYASAVETSLHATAEESFEAVRIVRSADPSRIPVANGARYPNGVFGNSLRQIAQLIKADVGVEVAFTDIGGWDTHAAEGGADGQLANRLRELAGGIDAFIRDLGSRMGDVVLVTVSEFGRTVRENGNRGTDHGHGNVMMVAGGGVRGGRVLGDWPGLGTSQLFEGRDLAVTTDFRDVFGEVLSKSLGVSDLRPVFSGYESSKAKWRGVV